MVDCTLFVFCVNMSWFVFATYVQQCGSLAIDTSLLCAGRKGPEEHMQRLHMRRQEILEQLRK